MCECVVTISGVPILHRLPADRGSDIRRFALAGKIQPSMQHTIINPVPLRMRLGIQAHLAQAHIGTVQLLAIVLCTMCSVRHTQL